MFDCQTSNDRYNFNSQGVRVDGDVIYLEDILDPGGVYGVTGKEKLVSKLLLSILQNSSYEPFSEEKRPLELCCKGVTGRQPSGTVATIKQRAAWPAIRSGSASRTTARTWRLVSRTTLSTRCRGISSRSQTSEEVRCNPLPTRASIPTLIVLSSSNWPATVRGFSWL